MNILVAKNGSQLGPFSEGDIRAKLASGEFAPTDFGWREGMASWVPLSQMFADASPSGPAAPAPAPYPQPTAQDPAPSAYAPQPYSAPQGQYSAPGTQNSPYPAAYQPGAMSPWGGMPGAGGYAGFWLRFVAAIIDNLILVIPNFVIGFVIGLVMSAFGSAGRNAAGAVGYLVGIVVTVTYFALMESSARQATFGKMALGLTVTDLNGGRITFGQAIGRNLGKYVSAIILFIGYIMAGFTERKQALHDMMASTLVVKK